MPNQNATSDTCRRKALQRGRVNGQKSKLERVKGIEPSSVAWEATALPLSYTRSATIITSPRQRGNASCVLAFDQGAIGMW